MESERERDRNLGKLQVWMPRPMLNDLRRIARDHDSLSSLVRQILREWLRTHREPVQ
jgi:hypothetical protein